MHRKGRSSQKRYNTLHEDLKVLCDALLEFYNITIVCGSRGKLMQNKAFYEGKSKVMYPNSKHNTLPSLAVDIASYEVNSIDWTMRQAIYLAGTAKGVAERLYLEGKMKHKIRIGIDWNNDNNIDDQTFNDPAHIELIL